MSSPAADRELLDRVLADSGVDTTAELPGWGAYLMELGRRLGELMDRALARAIEALGASGELAVPMARVVLVLAVALVAWWLAHRLWGLRHRRSRAGEEPATVREVESAAPGRGAAWWWGELERRLAAGRPLEALEALWWWLARHLAGERADPSWTVRELAAAAGRPDLLPLARRLDLLAYGPWTPRVEEVQEVAGGLRRALG